MRIWIVLLCIVGLGCAAATYEQGYAPIYGCRGDQAVWRMGWRENVSTDQWTVLGEYKWDEWTEGRSIGDPPSRVMAIRRSGTEISVNVEGTRPLILFPVYECTYLGELKTVMFYARHVRRWKE